MATTTGNATSARQTRASVFLKTAFLKTLLLKLFLLIGIAALPAFAFAVDTDGDGLMRVWAPCLKISRRVSRVGR